MLERIVEMPLRRLRPKPRHRPIQAPRSVPVLTIIGATPGMHSLRYADSDSPFAKAKPYGAVCLQLFVAITQDGPGSLADARFLQTVTRTPFITEFEDRLDGKLATYYARWATGRGQTGPWSAPVSFRIAA